MAWAEGPVQVDGAQMDAKANGEKDYGNEDPKDENSAHVCPATEIGTSQDNTGEQSNKEVIDTHFSQDEVFPTEVLVPNETGSSHTVPQEVITHTSEHEVIEIEIGVVVPNEIGSSHTIPQEFNDTNLSQHEVIDTEVENEEQAKAASMKSEILKSVLYGGLTELIASLGIVTSAASTGATTGKIVALSLANLITGLFVMSYKISEHWMNNRERGPNDEPIEEEVDRYEELFGERQNHRLHLTVAILSFVIFGLVPPLVYGFTFRKPEDKILKVPTGTIVSVLCIGILGAGKAYIEKPENCLVYVHIIGRCIVDAIGTSSLTTFGGELIEKYVEQAVWFDFETNKVPTLFLPSMDFQNQTWRSF